MSVSPSRAARTILFWVSIVFLGFMLWKLQSANSSSQQPSDWVPILINAAPLILLVGFCLFVMRQMQKKSSRWNRGGPRTSRTGIGDDFHWLGAGGKLVLGGI